MNHLVDHHHRHLCVNTINAVNCLQNWQLSNGSYDAPLDKLESEAKGGGYQAVKGEVRKSKRTKFKCHDNI